MLCEYLKENYSAGEPVFSGDIDIPGMTEENIRYHLKKLTDEGTICRFEPGIYYFPKSSMLGDGMSLSTDTVVFHKYILRRPLTEITEENIDVLQFLYCLKDVDRCAEEELEICGDILTKYAREHDITRNVIDRFITKYSVKIYKAIYETGVKYVSA